MIQQTNPRQLNVNTNLTSSRHIQDSPEEWGMWQGSRHYSLEIVQNPVRARMCGFGDKDRRPLAPAAVAKMVVKTEDDSFVDVDDVDFTFFLVTVDLWSADGKQEMNLVLHPSSADRFVPPNTTKSKRRGTIRTSDNQTSIPHSSPSSSQFRSGAQATNAGAATPSAPPQATNLNNQNYYPHVGDSMGFPPSSSYSAPETPTWGYPAQNPAMERNTNFSPPVLPSIASFSRTPSTSSLVAGTEQWSPEQDSESLPYRGWTTETAYQQSMDAYHSPIDPALRGSTSDGRDGSSWNHGSERYTHDVNPSVDNAYPSAGYAQHQVPPPPSQYYASNTVPTPAPVQPLQAVHPTPRHTYTRTLIGPLSANASRLLDEHRKPGIFFLFQDLSVRTEGTFRLRLRLMNIGAPPAPEAGATCVHNDVSPVLAQTFTEPFVVYSAKRFPGVPDTTALSIAFGNQGQKLPLRNRHGSGKRRRRDDSSDEGDSDGA